MKARTTYKDNKISDGGPRFCLHMAACRGRHWLTDRAVRHGAAAAAAPPGGWWGHPIGGVGGGGDGRRS